MTNCTSPLAGTPSPACWHIDVAKSVSVYYAIRPDPDIYTIDAESFAGRIR
jgi:hypothetical protein